MESQTIKLKENDSHGQSGRFTSVVFPALLRLALLVGPLTFAVITFSHTPIFCVLLCITILSLWLTVDAGPFRPAQNATEPRASALPSVRNLIRLQWWNSLFCRALIVGAMFYSRLNV
jgi:hypothetical protein